MTTPSSDDARGPGRDQSTQQPPGTGPTGRRAERHDTSDLETTAVRRQGFLGVRADPGPQETETVTAADAPRPHHGPVRDDAGRRRVARPLAGTPRAGR
ncbi:hypothetical protein [Georgenia sp. SUBG003]|uniref:hypothetical protein n=1 Tax=Georgenia sp. SUBG003 TaxID=1497974 RepID=UPI0004D83A2B|nr:hypothetical protein DA06_23165 [Georgenia sp. SUBG003]